MLQAVKDEVKTMAQAFFGGVHPNDMKAATNEKAIEQLSPPARSGGYSHVDALRCTVYPHRVCR